MSAGKSTDGKGVAMMTDIDRIREALQFINPCDRDTWLRMGMAIKSAIGDTGLDLWDTWSQQAESFNAKDSRDVWKSIRAGGEVTVGTLFYEAKANGWRDDGGYQKPSTEALEERKRLAAEARAKDEAKIEAERAETAKKAQALWKAAQSIGEDHPYLVRKGLKPVVSLREIDDSRATEILGYALNAGGEALTGRLLVAPIKQGEHLSSCELIDESGRKAALSGRGTKAGGYWAAQKLPEGDGEGLSITLAEGIADALSVACSVACLAIAGLSSGNLPAIAQMLRQRYPKARIILVADLDKKTGEPDKGAVKAAQGIEALLAIPDFGPERDAEQKDINDLYRKGGAEAVRRCMEAARLVSGSEPASSEVFPSADNSKGKDWPDPLPVAAKIEPVPYPIDALPKLILAAVEEVTGFVKAPVPMVASSALAALSLAIQTHADVKRAEHLHGPVGLFLLTIADSGERKSTCDGFFIQAIRDYEEAQAEAAKPTQKEHRAAIEVWEAKCGGIKEKIRQLAKNQQSTDSMESVLSDLEHDKPEAPRIARLLYADATPEALAYGLAKQWPSGGVVSAEAGIVFGSHGMGKDSVMRNLGLLNQLWDGASLTIDRRSSESFTVRGARLTVALQVQEPTLREFLTRSGGLARGTGFLARFLLAWPESTQGQRPFTEAPSNWPHLAAFNRRIAEILDQPAPIDEDGALTPVMLSMTPNAKAAWVRYYDAIENELRPDGELFNVRDVASKSADNAARLAALFQIFEGADGLIAEDAIERASRIAAWHLSEARRFFSELTLSAEQMDAARLDSWLIKYCQKERTPFVPIRDAQRLGPVRDKVRLTTALRGLEELDRVKVAQEGHRKTIKLNPALVETP